jgi:virulence-associated protein VapD
MHRRGEVYMNSFERIIKILTLSCIMFFCLFSPILGEVNNINKLEIMPTESNTVPVESTIKSAVPVISNDKNEFTVQRENDYIQQKDLYEALLATKEDKNILLSNIINWLLAFAAIAIIGIASIYGLLWRKTWKKYLQAEKLIKNLDTKEKFLDVQGETIKQMQEKVNKYMESGEFNKRIEYIENSISKIRKYTDKIEQAEAVEENKIKEGIISDIWYLITHTYPERFKNDIEGKIYEKAKSIDILSKQEKLKYSVDELQSIREPLKDIHREYRQANDPPA